MLGQKLRNIRKSRNLTIKEIAEGIATIPFLSNVEKGKSDISLSKFAKIIDRLNVSESELFELLKNPGKQTQFEFIEELFHIIEVEDIHMFNQALEVEEKLFLENKNYRHKHNAILIELYKNYCLKLPINKHQLTELYQYLCHVDQWGIYECNLYGNCAVFLSSEKVFQLFRIAMKNITNLVDKENHLQFLSRIGFNIIINLLDNEEYSNAFDIIASISKKLKGTAFYYEINKCNYLHGVYLVKTGNTDDGIKKMDKSINIMYELGDNSFARAHKNKMDSLLI